jgi:hypothetical protein
VEAHELERLRRSIAALQGSSAGPLIREAPLKLMDEVMSSRRETASYREAVAELRRVREALDRGTAGSANRQRLGIGSFSSALARRQI